MKKRLARCFRGFASVSGRFNIEVFYTISDFGYSVKLFTCTECGELFLMDTENPDFSGKSVSQIVGNATCPKCNNALKETLKPYPDNFRTDRSEIGQFHPDRFIPPDSESVIKEFWEIGS